MRPELLLLPAYLLAVIRLGWWWIERGWELPEGEGPPTRPLVDAASSGAAGSQPQPSPPSESSWPALPDTWTPEDVELTLMDIEYAEAFRG